MDKNAPPIYGTQKAGLPKKLGERLRELWEPHEYVRIMNIDNETFYWQVLAPQDETFNIDKGPTKITYRRSPRQYSIKSGESIPLEGWNAYVAVEQLYKKIIAKKEIANRGDRKEIIFNWEDPNGWDKYLPQIFLGQETPTFGGQEITNPVSNNETPTPAVISSEDVVTNNKSVKELAKELGIDVE